MSILLLFVDVDVEEGDSTLPASCKATVFVVLIETESTQKFSLVEEEKVMVKNPILLLVDEESKKILEGRTKEIGVVSVEAKSMSLKGEKFPMKIGLLLLFDGDAIEIVTLSLPFGFGEFPTLKVRVKTQAFERAAES